LSGGIQETPIGSRSFDLANAGRYLLAKLLHWSTGLWATKINKFVEAGRFTPKAAVKYSP
jgi:hypothetical protein